MRKRGKLHRSAPDPVPAQLHAHIDLTHPDDRSFAWIVLFLGARRSFCRISLQVLYSIGSTADVRQNFSQLIFTYRREGRTRSERSYFAHRNLKYCDERYILRAWHSAYTRSILAEYPALSASMKAVYCRFEKRRFFEKCSHIEASSLCMLLRSIAREERDALCICASLYAEYINNYSTISRGNSAVVRIYI